MVESEGSSHARTTLPSPAVAVRPVGRPGGAGTVGAGSVGVAATYHGGPEGLPAPPAFTARSLKRYSVPLASPSTAAVVTLPGTAAHWPQATPAQRTLYS